MVSKEDSPIFSSLLGFTKTETTLLLAFSNHRNGGDRLAFIHRTPLLEHIFLVLHFFFEAVSSASWPSSSFISATMFISDMSRHHI